MKKYQTATTEQKAGQVDTNGKPLSPNPPDDSGEWQLIGLHTFTLITTLPTSTAIERSRDHARQRDYSDA